MNHKVAPVSQLAYGPLKEIVLLGGGALLRKTCLWAKLEGIPVKVVTAPRHAVEMYDHVTLTDFFKRHDIPGLVTEKLDTLSVKKFLGNTENIFCLSLGAAWIFQENIIASLFHDRLLNLHCSRLPQSRGAGGFSWQILMGDRLGYCVLHRIDGGVDTGSIVAYDEFLYPPECRKPIDYERVCIDRCLGLIANFTKSHRSCTTPLELITQPEYLSSCWPRLHTDTNGWIDWSLDPAEIERFICAFDDPYAGAQSFLNGTRVRLKSVCLNLQDGHFHSFQSGLVYRKSKHWLCVALKGAGLVVEQIHNEHGVSIFDTIKIGDRFITPSTTLDAAKHRPVYTPTGLKEG